MKKIETETWLGAIFGIIAIVAIGFEMYLDGFSAMAIAGGVKDIAGTVVAVLLFLFAMSQIKVKNKKGFDVVFEKEMGKLVEKYSPVIQKYAEMEDGANANNVRYDIARKLDCISGKESGASHLFFRCTKGGPTSIVFTVRRAVFGENTELVAARLQRKIEKMFAEYIQDVKTGTDEVQISFNRKMGNDQDAVVLAEIVDCVLLICIAEYRS